jgi:hypothetical protein
VGPRASLDAVVKRKISFSCPGSNSDSPVNGRKNIITMIKLLLSPIRKGKKSYEEYYLLGYNAV